MHALLLLLLLFSPIAAPEVKIVPHYLLQDCGKKFVDLVKHGPKYLAKNAVALATAYPDAEKTASEIEGLLALQLQRTPQQIKQINEEAPDLVPVFLAEFATSLQKKPKTTKMLREALIDVDYFLFAEKIALLRPRPHQVDGRIHPAIAVPKHPAFPSGHGGESAAIALLLAKLIPQQSSHLNTFAQSVGHNREIAGVHYPSDTQEGVRIGQMTAKLLLETPKFNVLVDAAKREWLQPWRGRIPRPPVDLGPPDAAP